MNRTQRAKQKNANWTWTRQNLSGSSRSIPYFSSVSLTTCATLSVTARRRVLYGTSGLTALPYIFRVPPAKAVTDLCGCVRNKQISRCYVQLCIIAKMKILTYMFVAFDRNFHKYSSCFQNNLSIISKDQSHSSESKNQPAKLLIKAKSTNTKETKNLLNQL